jgi:hypothetical protein
MNDFGPAVRKILRENGCWLHRQGKGDHEIWPRSRSTKR